MWRKQGVVGIAREIVIKDEQPCYRSMRGVIPAGYAAGIDRRNPPRNFQYTNALLALDLQYVCIAYGQLMGIFLSPRQ